MIDLHDPDVHYCGRHRLLRFVCCVVERTPGQNQPLSCGERRCCNEIKWFCEGHGLRIYNPSKSAPTTCKPTQFLWSRSPQARFPRPQGKQRIDRGITFGTRFMPTMRSISISFNRRHRNLTLTLWIRDASGVQLT